MAKITRYGGNFKAFGSDATGTERTVFGSTTQTDDLTTNLGAEYQRGWGVLPSGQKPPKQYFNGALFGTSQAVAYLHQAGVAEWNGEQEYHAGSIANRNGQIFVCLTDDHVSASAPETDSTNWRLDDGSVATISALLNRTTVGTVNVLNCHTGLEGGGGVFYWDASKPKTEHNGGTVIDPSKVFPADWNNQTQLTAWFTSGSSGTGCWVRQYDGSVNVKWFGAKGDGATDDSVIINNCINSLYKTEIFFPKGKYLIKSSIVVKNSNKLIGCAYPENKDISNGSWLFVDFGANTVTPEIDAAIKLNLTTGIEGFGFYYPNQVASSGTTPVPYGWSISTSKTATGETFNTDGIVCKKIMLLNSYLGLDLTNSSQFTVQEIFGQPIKTGLKIDQIYDVGTIERVHFWTFNAAPGTNLYSWIKSNGTAFDIKQADFVTIKEPFCYGYNIGYNLNGEFWGSIYSPLADICNYPLVINRVNNATIYNPSLTTGDLSYSLITTGNDINGTLKINDLYMYSGSTLGALISSSSGEIIFNNCTSLKTTSNGIRCLDIVNLSTCKIGVNGGDIRTPSGKNISINNIPYPVAGSDLTSTNINNVSGWSGIHINNITNGIQFASLPTTMYNSYTITNKDIYNNFVLFSFDYSVAGTYEDSNIRIFICKNDGTETIELFGGISMPNQSFHYEIPLYIQELTTDQQLRVERSTYSSNNAYFWLQNMSFKKISNNDMNFYCIKNSTYADTKTFGLTLTGGIRTMYGTQYPTSGTYNAGDRIINKTPTVGQPKAWVCTASGAPGTWVSEGNL